MRTPLLVAGAALLAAAALWRLHLGRRWTDRIPPDFVLKATYVGTSAYPDPKTGRFPERDDLGHYERITRALGNAGGPARPVLVEDLMRVRDLRTDTITWEYLTRAVVDRRTGSHVIPQYAGEFVLFPREVERRTYRIRSNYLKGVPLAFVRAENVEGLETYLFEYRGRVEYTESYGGSHQYSGVKTKPGEEIRCADDQFYYRAWVEPRTGEVVKREEGCPSGDFVYDAAGNTLYPVLRWSGVTAGDDLLSRVGEVRAVRGRYMWASRYVPLSLALGGVLAVGAALRPRRRPAAA